MKGRSEGRDHRCVPRCGDRRASWRASRRAAAPSSPAFVAFAAVAIGAVACEPPDRPPALTEGLPRAAVAYLAPDRVSTFRIEDGVTYHAVRSGPRPWTLHLVEADTERCDVGFQVAKAGDAEGRVTVSQLARRSEPGVVAAVNGDFFTPENLPVGPELSEGTLRNRSSRSVFAWRPGDLPWVGKVRWTDGVADVGPWTVTASHPDPRLQMVAGFPPLLQDGLVVGDLEQEARPDFAAVRDPRTAVGFDRRSGRVWLVVVEGRREGSEGMTLPELARLFQALGVDDAVNLDGGGSSVMVIRRETVSRPSDPTGERPVVNALVLKVDPLYCS